MPIDLVLSDIEMPELDGLKLLALTREEHPRLPFILVTGHTALDSAIAALRSGATDFLQKPIQPQQLRQLVERVFENIRLARENRCLIEQLESERLKSDFVAIASHEIRTPLTAIKNCLGILRGGTAGPLTPDQERFLRLADQNLDRLTRIAEDFSDLARLDEGQLTLIPKQFDLRSVLADVVSQLKDAIAQKRLTVDQASPAAGIRVFGDRKRLGQVFHNILRNAIDFSHAEGKIWIESAIRAVDELPEEKRSIFGRNPGPLIEVCITDDGDGISAGQEERIFERFVQASATLQRARRPRAGTAHRARHR